MTPTKPIQEDTVAEFATANDIFTTAIEHAGWADSTARKYRRMWSKWLADHVDGMDAQTGSTALVRRLDQIAADPEVPVSVLKHLRTMTTAWYAVAGVPDDRTELSTQRKSREVTAGDDFASVPKDKPLTEGFDFDNPPQAQDDSASDVLWPATVPEETTPTPETAPAEDAALDTYPEEPAMNPEPDTTDIADNEAVEASTNGFVGTAKITVTLDVDFATAIELTQAAKDAGVDVPTYVAQLISTM